MYRVSSRPFLRIEVMDGWSIINRRPPAEEIADLAAMHEILL